MYTPVGSLTHQALREEERGRPSRWLEFMDSDATLEDVPEQAEAPSLVTVNSVAERNGVSENALRRQLRRVGATWAVVTETRFTYLGNEKQMLSARLLVWQVEVAQELAEEIRYRMAHRVGRLMVRKVA